MATKIEEINTILVGMAGTLLGTKRALELGCQVNVGTIETLQADVRKIEQLLWEMPK